MSERIEKQFSPVEQKFIDALRKYIQDFPNKNKLLGKQEHTDEDLLFYLKMALDDFNTTPPLLRPFEFKDFEESPRLPVSLLLQGAVVFMMLSLGILNYRNQVSFSDGGSMIQLFEKGPQYFQGATMFANNYTTQKIALKKFLNTEQGWAVIRPLNHYPQFPYL